MQPQTLIYIIETVGAAVLIGYIYRAYRYEVSQKDRLYVWTVNLREDLEKSNAEIQSRGKTIKGLQEESRKYSMALRSAEYLPGGTARMYEVYELGANTLFRTSSAREAAFRLTDWSSPSAHLDYWEIIGKLYSITRGTTSGIVSGYNIKVS